MINGKFATPKDKENFGKTDGLPQEPEILGTFDAGGTFSNEIEDWEIDWDCKVAERINIAENGSGARLPIILKRDYDMLRAAYEKAISEGRERRWPDDFETGVQHAYEVAACQPDLHTALRAIADEINADACHPNEHECPTCRMVRPSRSAAKEQVERLKAEWVQRESYLLGLQHEAEERERAARKALQQFAECNLNDSNCASLEVATARIRSIARAALRAGEKT